jgi:hypothetical protein
MQVNLDIHVVISLQLQIAGIHMPLGKEKDPESFSQHFFGGHRYFKWS